MLLLLFSLRKGVLSPLAGLISGTGEKLGVVIAVLYGVLETVTEYGIETFFCAITLTVGTDDDNFSECFVKSSTYNKSSMRATMLYARLSRTLE